ncbi:MAG: hypothetical protein HC888_00025 [Candidatus Competibacteraceae bacterium]|nr:hypothetical protein [Candidatus Competibacteraceae bacterium]
MPVIVHSDGSVHQNEISELRKHLPGCEVIERAMARRDIGEFLKPYPNLAQYRCVWERILFYKLIDFYYYSKTKRILAFDSDVLWLKKPTEVNERLGLNKGFFMDDIQNAYGFDVNALRRHYGIRLLPRINSGIIYIPGEDAFNLDLLDYAASLGIKHDQDKKIGRGGWFEQTLFATLFSVECDRYERLNRQQYLIPEPQAKGTEDVTAVHCVTPRRSLFSLFAEKSLERQGFEGLF